MPTPTLASEPTSDFRKIPNGRFCTGKSESAAFGDSIQLRVPGSCVESKTGFIDVERFYSKPTAGRSSTASVNEHDPKEVAKPFRVAEMSARPSRCSRQRTHSESK